MAFSTASGWPQGVWILRIWADEPVYHELGKQEYIAGRGYVDYTLCGREVSGHTPYLPFKHARKFARPCRSCWPEGL